LGTVGFCPPRSRRVMAAAHSAALVLLALAAVAARGSPVAATGDGPGTCSAAGPASMQQRTARTTGGALISRADGVASPSACASRCCDADPCRSWTHVDAGGTCELRSGYSSATPNATATSGVVYRTAALQTSPPQEFYAGLRGFNYVPPQAVNDIDMWVKYSRSVTERDMAIAQATGFNFCRVFLNYHVWEADPQRFVENVQHFVATAHGHGVSVMPIPFDLCWFGCRNETVSAKSDGKCWYPSPQFSLADNKTWWTESGERYVDALVRALPAGTPGLALWDVVNEPESGGASHLPGEKKGPRWLFVEHFVKYFQTKTTTPATVGVASVDSLATIGGVVDVLTFHSYHSSWEQGLQRTEFALGVARAQKKPVFNSETGCIARANAFDQTMEMAIRNGIGFAVWELMISDCLDCIDTRRWKHGLMYRDGTTRDPSGVAALHGVFLNRGDNVELAVARPDVEHAVSGTVAAAQKWLDAANSSTPGSFGMGLTYLDSLANLGESAQVLPLAVPLSARARQLAAAGESSEARAQLGTLLHDQLGALSATKMGSEVGPGTCEFPGAPLPPGV
jgi:hypothetical protein